MKNSLPLAVAAVLTLSLTACGADATPGQSPSSSAPQSSASSTTEAGPADTAQETPMSTEPTDTQEPGAEETATDGATSPEDPTSTATDPSAEPGSKDEAQEVGADAKLKDPKPMKWKSASKVDENTIALNLSMGNPRCYGVNTKVVESADKVVVTVLHGRIAEAPMACTEQMIEAVVKVKTKDPIGDKKIEQPKVAD